MTSNFVPLIRGLIALCLVSAGRGFSAEAEFANANFIPIPASGTFGVADPYPSVVTVSGLSGSVRRVVVKLSGLSHTFPQDLDVLLVGPEGKKVMLMSFAGGGSPVTNIDLTFDDSAVSQLSAAELMEGTFRPGDYGVGDIPVPAPPAPYAAALAEFNGSNPNGDWLLYVNDRAEGDSGSLAGWSVSVYTTTITGLSVASKMYDGSAAAALTGTAVVNGVAEGDEVTLAGTPVAAFASANAGTTIPVTVNGYSLTGADGGNYTLSQPTGLSGDITAAGLTVSGVSVVSKVYDGTTAATLGGTPQLVGVVAGDDVALVGTPSARFASADVGAGIPVTVSGYMLSGADAGNYTLSQPVGLSGDITAAGLTISGLSVVDKVYDGTVAAALEGTAQLVGVMAGDDVALAGTPVASFVSADVGTGIPVTVSGYALSGADAGNYTLSQPAGLTGDIAAAGLTVTGLSVVDKVYDGTATATLEGSPLLGGVVAGDDVAVAGTPAASFGSAGVGVGIPVTVNGYALSGGDAGNYILSQPVGLSGEITAAGLAISGLSVADKMYDGTVAAALEGTAQLTGVVAGDDVAVAGTPAASFASLGVGAGIPVTVSGYALSGADAGNYTLSQPAGLTGNITVAGLTVNGVSVSGKVYDATTAASLAGTAQLVGVVAGDDVALAGTPSARFASADVGTGIPVTVSGYALVGADAGNYALSQPVGLTGDITAAGLTISGLSVVGKVYDGTVAATLGGTAQLVGVVPGDEVALTGSPAASFASAHVGTGIPVTVSGYSLGGADAGNYTLSQPVGLSGDITAAGLMITGLSVTGKVYDGTAMATLEGSPQLLGAMAGDQVEVAGTPVATFVSAEVGAGIPVSVTGYTLSGADAANYTLSQPTGLSGDITAAGLTITGLSVADKVYDGTATATLEGSTLLVGVVAGDEVEVAGTPVASFVSADVGTGIPVTVSGYALSGTDAGNYTLAQPVGLSGDITAAGLSISGLSVADKIYDGTATATLEGTPQLVGVVTGDDVALVGTPVANFASGDVGTSIPVSVTGYALAGADAGNYTLVQPAGLSGDITAAGLTITGLSVSSKVYDGTAAATLAGTPQLQSVVAGDEVALSGTPVANFVSADVGTGIPVTVTGYALSGPDAGNYALSQLVDLTGDIAAAGLTVTGLSVVDKVYDGTATATLGGTAQLVGVVAGDEVEVTGTPVASFVSADVGTGISVTVSGYALSGTDAGNYLLTQPTGLTGDITAAGLTITGLSVADKVYDGTATATLEGPAELAGVVGGDDVVLSGRPSASFASADAGTGIPVTVSGYMLSGADAGNYLLAQPAGLTGEITARVVSVAAVQGQSKVAGELDPVFTYEILAGSLVGQDAFTGRLTREPGEATGSYAIRQGTLTAGPNYKVEFFSADFLIFPALRFALDGYISNGTVFFDANGNGNFDRGEPAAHTGERGEFELVFLVSEFDVDDSGTLDIGEGSLVVMGGIDIATGLNLSIPLRAPFEAEVVTPLTTLLVALLEQGEGIAAKGKIHDAFGLPEELDLMKYDPFAAATSGDPRATQVLKVSGQVQDTTVQITALLSTVSGQSAQNLAGTVMQVLSTRAATGEPVGLSDAEGVAALILSVEQMLALELSEPIRQGAAEIIAAGNVVKEEIAASAVDSATAAREISRSQVVAQGRIAATLEAVGAGDADIEEAMAAYTGDALNSAIQRAPVGDLTGEEVAAGLFAFDNTDYRFDSRFQESAGLGITRSEGNKGRVDLVLTLSTGETMLNVNVTFADRQLIQWVDVTELIRNDDRFVNADVVDLSLGFAGAPANGAELAEPSNARVWLGNASISLEIDRSGGGLILSWPLNGKSYEVERSDRIGAGAEWSPVGGVASVVEGRNQVEVEILGEDRFFRLREKGE